MKKDLPLALKIKEVIKGGTIEHPGNSDYLNLLFQDLNSCYAPKDCTKEIKQKKIKILKIRINLGSYELGFI